MTTVLGVDERPLLHLVSRDAENGAAILECLRDWFGRFISVVNVNDLDVLALWSAHTHLAEQLYTTPRLRLDSIAPASGKTTVLDHLARLCHRPVQASALSSYAVLPRLLADGPRTVLVDEVDRVLRPGKAGRQSCSRSSTVRLPGGGYLRAGGARQNGAADADLRADRDGRQLAEPAGRHPIS